LKRSLQVVDDSDDAPSAPLLVSLGRELVSVVDTGSGVASARFVDALVDAGAQRSVAVGDERPSLRIVIRTAWRSPAARLRAEGLEAGADLILGSVRPAFAKRFVSTCASWANS